MIAFVLAVILAQASAAPEPFPYSPEGEKLGNEAYDLLNHGKVAEAAKLLRDLIRVAPENPRAHRLLGFALLDSGDNAGAEKELTRALDLHVDAKRVASTLTGRAQARFAQRNSFGARADINKAMAADPSDAGARSVSAFLYLREQEWAAAASEASRAIDLAPASAFPHTILAHALLEQGDHGRSRVEAAKARALGFSDTRWLDGIDESNTRAARVALAWQVPLACLVVMALGLLVLFAAGAALSRAQLGTLTTLHPHMLRSEQTVGERLVLRLYLGVLWFGTIFFYVSVPAMVLLSLAVGIGLVYLMVTQLSQIPVKLVLIALIAGLGGTWAVLRGLFLPAFAGTSGKEITGTDEPRLFAALREVSEVAGTRMVDRVYLEPGAEAAVRESGGVVRVLFGGGERVLHLGFWTLQGLTVGELKAILAHEYGHFAHGETRLTPVVSRIVNTLLGMLQRMAALGRSTWLNPVYWYLRVYFRIFLAVTSSHSRRSELLADRAAALAYGGDVFGKALRKAVESGDEFDRQAGKITVLLRMGGRPCTGLYRALEAACALAPRKLRDGRLKQLLETEPGQFDSHPPAADRIARVAGVPGSHAAEDAPALSLLSDPEATAQLLATLVQSRIDAQLAARSELGKDQPMDPGAQVLFAEGLALHDAALALQGLKDPEGDAMLASAVERFEAALGPDDPILVVALKNLAVTQRRLGRKDEAMATLDRALAILVEHPDVDAERDLSAMRTELAAA